MAMKTKIQMPTRQTITEKAKESIGRLLGRHAKPRRDVALVLSSGGARGLAHIGAIDALLANGYHITSICGTSFGAVVAAMYATGHLEDFKTWMQTIDRKKISALTDFKPGLSYFVKGHRIIEELAKISPDCDIETLPIPFACIATDWKTGREVVFRKGSMWRAVRASISIPGTLEPIEMDGKILIDGGITNPFPLNRVRRNKDDLLVGVNVSGHDYGSIWQRKEIAKQKAIQSNKVLQILARLFPDSRLPLINFYSLLDQTVSIAIAQNARRQIALTPPDILVDIPMRRFSGNDYDKFEQIRKLGEKKTEKILQAAPPVISKN